MLKNANITIRSRVVWGIWTGTITKIRYDACRGWMCEVRCDQTKEKEIVCYTALTSI